MDRWRNKIAVVTGASSGIGEACTKALLAAGMVVVGLARRLERMEGNLKASLSKDQQKRFYPKKCDVSVEDDIKNAFAWVESELGGVDVLVNNAGILRYATQIVNPNNSEDLRSTVNINILGAAFCIREAFQSMKKRGVDGHVVIMNSIAGHRIPNTAGGVHMNIYPPTKHALTAMTEVLRQEFLLNGTKIRVTSISPGVVVTELMEAAAPNLIHDVPSLKSEDVADAMIYCLQTPPHVQIHELIIKPVGEIC